MFVAGFIGSPAMNFFTARVHEVDDHLELDGTTFSVEVPADRADELREFVDRELTFGIRPENIHDAHFVPRGVTTAPLKVKVDVTELMGNEVFLHMLAGENKLLARVDPRTSLTAGDEAEVMMDLERMHVFDPESSEVLKSGVGGATADSE